MKKNTFLLCMIVSALAIGGLRVMMAQKSIPLKVLAKPPIPVIGKSYIINQLKTLINMNNPADTSDFLVLTDAKGTVLKAGTPVANAGGSKSAKNAGLDGIISSNMQATVSLNSATNLITLLGQTGRLAAADVAQYSKILLYFELGGYWFFISDPWPGKIVVGRVNPAKNIISKWDFTKIY